MQTFPEVSPTQVLLRTLLSKRGVREGKPHFSAFMPKPKDKDGISLFYNEQEAGKRFENPIYGFLDVYVGSVRKIKHNEESLDVIQDEEFHALIIGIPNFNLMPKDTKEQREARKTVEKQAEVLTLVIAKQASKINSYVPEGFSPKDLLKLTE